VKRAALLDPDGLMNRKPPKTEWYQRFSDVENLSLDLNI
jgi:hypothetical protein